jgi:hypothetical protein
MLRPIIPICRSFCFYGGIHQAKFATEINHKNVYYLSGMKYCLYVNNFKHMDDVKLQG